MGTSGRLTYQFGVTAPSLENQSREWQKGGFSGALTAGRGLEGKTIALLGAAPPK
jgi:hypothetical protein